MFSRLLRRGLAFGAVLYALIAVGLTVFQRDLIYFPNNDRPDRAQVGVAAVRDVEIVTADGLRLLAWYLPPPAGQPLIVFFHGNAGHLGYRDGRMAQIHKAGFGALFPEYRGYGGNPGIPTEEGFYIDARAALDFVAAEGFSPSRIVLMGESLGTGAATRMASERAVGAVVLETPYSSVADVAQHRLPLLPIRLLLKDHFDAASRIGAARAPVLVMVGGQDDIIPPRFGRRLFDAANDPKELWISPEGGHNLVDFGSSEIAFSFIRKHIQ